MKNSNLSSSIESRKEIRKALDYILNEDCSIEVLLKEDFLSKHYISLIEFNLIYIPTYLNRVILLPEGENLLIYLNSLLMF